MEKITLNINLLHSKAEAPFYATEGSSGLDLKAILDENIILKPMQRYLISTGLSIEIPNNYEIQIRPRSGLALKYGVTVLNSPGTIDSDYRGEIKVLLINLGDENFIINNGDKIAQMVVCEVVKSEILVKANLSETKRGVGGFGSTGDK
jgi:dUTP pyrophosphatase